MEKRDLYNKDRELLGKIILKGEDIPVGEYIVVVLIFIQNSKGEFLIQKRSKIKNGTYATTGGHPKSGESSIQGIITEVKEEIGIELDKNKVQLFYSERDDKQRIFCDAYYTKMDIKNIEKLKLQLEEVEFVKWLTVDEINELIKKDKFFYQQIDKFEFLLNWIGKRA